MELSQKAMERINGMTKGQVQRALADIQDGIGNPAALDALLARMLKFAPPAPTPFPRQAELDEAYAQIKLWSDTAKELIKEAKQGNYTYRNSDSQTVRPGRARKAATTTTGKAQIVIGANVYTSWSKAADGENVKPDLSRTVARNWRPLVMAATTGTVKLTGTTVEEYTSAFPIPEGCDWTYEVATE